MPDRKKVIKALDCEEYNKCSECPYVKFGKCNVLLIRDVKELLKEQEPVRCKDCKYNDDGECIIKAGWFPVKPDWFCADGERQEGG